MQKFTGQNGTDSTGKNESTVKRCISSERNSRFKFHIFFFPAGTIPLYVSHIQGTIEKSLSSIVWQQRPFSERWWCHSLSQITVGRLNVLRYQNIFITDIGNFMNHMISLFCGRGDSAEDSWAEPGKDSSHAVWSSVPGPGVPGVLSLGDPRHRQLQNGVEYTWFFTVLFILA